VTDHIYQSPLPDPWSVPLPDRSDDWILILRSRRVEVLEANIKSRRSRSVVASPKRKTKKPKELPLSVSAAMKDLPPEARAALEKAYKS